MVKTFLSPYFSNIYQFVFSFWYKCLDLSFGSFFITHFYIYCKRGNLLYMTLTRSYLKDKLNELFNYYLLIWRQQRQHSYSEISNKDTFIILTIHKHNLIKFCVVYINVTVLHVHHNTIQGRGVQYVRYFKLGTMKTNEFHTQ